MSSIEDTGEDAPTQEPKSNDDGDATGALQSDDAKVGEGTGEGTRGLGEQTGASGGGKATEPEDGTPERGQTAGN